MSSQTLWTLAAIFNMRLYIIICILIFASCNDKKEKFSYETSIASKTYEAQMKYLNNTLFNYSRMTEQGSLFYKQSLTLDSLAKIVKMQLELGNEIHKSEQSRLFEPFNKHFESNELIDLDVYKEIRRLSIVSFPIFRTV
jgi:hypothetical protein